MREKNGKMVKILNYDNVALVSSWLGHPIGIPESPYLAQLNGQLLNINRK